MKWFLYTLAVLLGALVIAYIAYGRGMLMILNGYAAKHACSCVFVGDLDEDLVREVDLGFFPVSMADITIDREQSVVSSSVMGLGQRKAVFREGLGCALVNGKTVAELQEQEFRSPQKVQVAPSWGGLDSGASQELNVSLQSFLADFVNAEAGDVNTRSLIVVHRGRVVGEFYRDGIDSSTVLPGWSMTKGLLATMYGTMLTDSLLNIHASALLPEWTDQRQKITYQDLLQMSSGLDWEEFYYSRSTATRMLYESDNYGSHAASSSLKSSPGTDWYYSSGTSNILSLLLADKFDGLRDYHAYPYERIFGRIGVESMVIETDPAGYFVGSSFGWATTRDWARMGQLYLNDGLWKGDTIVSPKWVQFARETVPSSNGMYGGHFWHNRSLTFPDIPEDAYYYSGFQGQFVVIIPSQDAVLTRLGVAYTGGFDLNGFVSGALGILSDE